MVLLPHHVNRRGSRFTGPVGRHLVSGDRAERQLRSGRLIESHIAPLIGLATEIAEGRPRCCPTDGPRPPCWPFYGELRGVVSRRPCDVDRQALAVDYYRVPCAEMLWRGCGGCPAPNGNCRNYSDKNAGENDVDSLSPQMTCHGDDLPLGSDTTVFVPERLLAKDITGVGRVVGHTHAQGRRWCFSGKEVKWRAWQDSNLRPEVP